MCTFLCKFVMVGPIYAQLERKNNSCPFWHLIWDTWWRVGNEGFKHTQTQILIFVLLTVTALAKVREINLMVGGGNWQHPEMTANVWFPQWYLRSVKSASQLSYCCMDSYSLTLTVTAGVSTAICDFTATVRAVCCWGWGRPVGWPGFCKVSSYNVWPSLAAVTQWWVWLVIRANILAHLGIQSTTFYMESWM